MMYNCIVNKYGIGRPPDKDRKPAIFPILQNRHLRKVVNEYEHLGLDWKIIHVPAEYISKDIQKLEQIIKILSKALN